MFDYDAYFTLFIYFKKMFFCRGGEEELASYRFFRYFGYNDTRKVPYFDPPPLLYLRYAHDTDDRVIDVRHVYRP